MEGRVVPEFIFLKAYKQKTTHYESVFLVI